MSFIHRYAFQNHELSVIVTDPHQDELGIAQASEAAQSSAYGQIWRRQVFDEIDCLQQLCRKRCPKARSDD